MASRGITVNVVSPGFTETTMLLANMGPDARRDFIEMTPLHRLGQPEDIAEAIVFLGTQTLGNTNQISGICQSIGAIAVSVRARLTCEKHRHPRNFLADNGDGCAQVITT